MNVSVKTQISQPPVDTRVILGRVATLQCKVSHAPSVTVHVQWSHGHNIIEPNGNPRVSVRNDGTLEIQEVRAADVGLYTCMVSTLISQLLFSTFAKSLNKKVQENVPRHYS